MWYVLSEVLKDEVLIEKVHEHSLEDLFARLDALAILFTFNKLGDELLLLRERCIIWEDGKGPLQQGYHPVVARFGLESGIVVDDAKAS